jgi:hypothetical protein
MSAACGLCERDPAEGFATINGERYCHGDVYPTCYMLACWGGSGAFHMLSPELPSRLPSMAALPLKETGQ